MQEIEKAYEESKEPLYEFYVAGVQHHRLHTCIKNLSIGDDLVLIPQPDNLFDPNAVKIVYYHPDDEDYENPIMLGYVPKAKGDYSSKVSAALMHKDLLCRVLKLDPEAKTWEQLKVGIFEEDEEPGEEK